MAANKSAYARLVGQENRLLNCRQDAALRAGDIRRQAAEKAAAYERRLRYAYDETHFASLGSEKVAETLLAASGAKDEAAEALMALGYTLADATKALEGVSPDLGTSARVREALKNKS